MNMQQTKFYGCDGLRYWLASCGFRIAPSSSYCGNACNWYAYRRSELPARECECNDGKPAQIVINPYEIVGNEQVEVDLIGEYGGVWYKLKAYSLSSDDLRARLPDVEASLVRAWNALKPSAQEATPCPSTT